MEVENRPTVKGIIVGCSVPILVFSGIILFFAMPNIIAWLGPNPPAPEITYGEFPFRIECELNGELIVIEDTLICEFDGFRLVGPSRVRQWKGHLASGVDYVVLLVNDNELLILGNIKREAYYMGEYGGTVNNARPSVVLKDGHNTRVLNTSELYDTYGIRLISWEFSPPIENCFH